MHASLSELISRVKKPEAQVALIAHRGGNRVAPENTLPAFQSAVEIGVDLVELDVHLTADDRVVVHHDRYARWLGERKLTISESTYEELKDVPLAQASPGRSAEVCIPPLEEVLSLLKGRAVPLVEIKRPKKGYRPLLETKVLEILDSLKMLDRAMVISFHKEILHRLKSREPAILVGLLTVSRRILAKRLPGWLDGIGVFRKILSRRALERLKNQGKFAFVWTVNDRETMEKFIDYGLDGIATDDPALLRALLFERHLQRL